MITSMQNPKIQLVRALIQKSKERKISGLFVVEGVRLVEELFAAGWMAEFILFTEKLSGRGKELINQAEEHKINIEEIDADLLKKIADTENPQGILAVAEKGMTPIPPKLDFVLICDSIRDPGNLGTIVRSSAAAGVQLILLSPTCADAFSPKVLRSAMGAHFHIPILEREWQEIREIVKGERTPLHVYLANAEGSINYWQADLTQPFTLIIGSEARGAGSEAFKMADTLIKIPMPGKSESLNAAMAASVLLFEAVRQRNP